jgi:hypothetical protein
MDSGLLTRPGFWYTFIALIIVTLFVYGIHIEDEKTELQQTQDALERASLHLSECQSTIQGKTHRITVLNNNISAKNTRLRELENRVAELWDSIRLYKNRPPDTIIRIIEKTVYRNRPASYHPYGKNRGKLTLYKSCNCYDLDIWIDGQYWGTIRTLYTESAPNCGQSGTLSKEVSSGYHHLQAKDKEGHSWKDYLYVKEDECLVREIKV